MGPGTIGLAATQVNLFVNTLLATSQGTGAASWLTYAFRLMYLPIGLFGVSIGTAVLPAVSRQAAVGDTAGIRHTVSRGLGMMLMLNVPATVGLFVLSTPIVQLPSSAAGSCRPTRPPLRRRRASTRLASSAIPRCASHRRPSMRSATAAFRRWSAAERLPST